MMKQFICTLCLLFAATQLWAKDYIFFLHNMFVEEAGPEGMHPEYGKMEYKEIVAAFQKAGFNVISEVRPKGTSGKAYARKVTKQIDSLISKGIAPSHITVVGTSKGGYIAQYISTYLQNSKINFVFIGCCSDEIDEDTKDIHFYGNILSIYEKTDKWRSCEMMKNRPGNKVTHYKEIELNTGMKHGYLYKALPLWIQPSIKWANRKYD